jgi:hypothetical protein
MSHIVKIWDWLIIDFDRVKENLNQGEFLLQFQTIPID